MKGLEFLTGLWGEGGMTLTFVIFLVWSLVWKGLALWRAAELRQKGWFIAFLIVNTIGILEILYLYVFSRKAKIAAAPSNRPPQPPQPPQP